MDTVYECDRLTDRRIMINTVQRRASHGKNRQTDWHDNTEYSLIIINSEICLTGGRRQLYYSVPRIINYIFTVQAYR